MDDLGYNDIGVQTYSQPTPQDLNLEPKPNYGAGNTDPAIPAPNKARFLTPAIDSLAAEGLRMTSFYAASLCSPSRASLLCGRYDRRVSITKVFFPTDADGLSTREVTLPEALRQNGYATAMVGKWHLGYNPSAASPFQMMPTRHGFQEFFGVPHSNDMANFSLMENEMIVEQDFSSPAQQAQITWRYTEKALDFIQRKSAAEQPFFLYLAQSMPHIPCFPSDRTYVNADGSGWPKFHGQTGISNYYDVMKEIDHSVRRILTKLTELGIDDETLVVFTSDNGPWLNLSNINRAERSIGSAYPLKDGKFTTWEGGVRVPFFARWPGHIPAGCVTAEVGGLVDLLPTFLGLAGGRIPADRTIDGVNLWPLWSGAMSSLDRSYAFHEGNILAAVLKGRWKLRNNELYDLKNDIQELANVAAVPANASVLADLRNEQKAITASLRADNEPRGVFTQYEVQISASDVVVPEGGRASFTVRLSANPRGPVTVSTAMFAGDDDLSVITGGILKFHQENWSAWQTVTLAAAQDDDAIASAATFRVATSESNVVREVFAQEQDDEMPASAASSHAWPTGVPAVITGGDATKSVVARARQSATVDFDPSGEFATQLHGGSYVESARGGLDNSVGMVLANLLPTTFDGIQSKSFGKGDFTSGKKLTTSIYFQLSSLGKNTGVAGQFLRLGLTNGGTSDFSGLPFSSIQCDDATTGSARFVIRQTNESARSVSSSFTLATGRWYYFEASFTRLSSSTAEIAYEMMLSNASADGSIGRAIGTYRGSTASGCNIHELNQAIFGAFKGHASTAKAVVDNFSVITELP